MRVPGEVLLRKRSFDDRKAEMRKMLLQVTQGDLVVVLGGGIINLGYTHRRRKVEAILFLCDYKKSAELIVLRHFKRNGGGRSEPNH